ncbi:MAG TPA: sigma-70 family RNA polymerase sigma factor [Phycisphaerae bacterium]|nr:sigma-70 family RNA polymerase sigma factor [Phycisphaerae bacterium]HRY71366.1 sigma-70 family RNA polymerase sigma factor [Phycisphaerae bacterium]HSA29710.1 sigma-70 family RNA polymerase sigma factor [Phycisphaerae bacterium]
MDACQLDHTSSSAGASSFPSTQWSLILAAGNSAAPDSRPALAQLCGKYWYPLYVYARRQGHGPQDAEDLTQAFFARFLEKKYFGLAEARRGRFRSFLLVCLRHFLNDESDRATAAKRGGGSAIVPFEIDGAEERYRVELADELTPEKAYERRWAAALLEHVLARLRQEYVAAGKSPQFEALRRFLWGADTATSYADVAAQLGSTESAVQTAVQRLRARCREILLHETAQTVATPEELQEEIHWLFAAFG